MRTNSAYAHLAYRKAIITETIALLRRKYMDDAGDPPARLVCEDVMHCDAEIPQEEFNSFLNDLETERAEYDLEMRKFEFVRKSNGQHQSQGAPGKIRRGPKNNRKSS